MKLGVGDCLLGFGWFGRVNRAWGAKEMEENVKNELPGRVFLKLISAFPAGAGK